MPTLTRCAPSILVVALLAATSPPVSAEPSAEACSVESVDWLAGTWVSEHDDRRIEETWLRPAGGATFGINRTVEGSGTPAWELLRIECRDGELTYLASPQGRQPPTPFVLDSEASDPAKFLVFRNPDHDYPQRIEYALESDDRLVARISGGLGTAVLSWTFLRSE